MERLEPILKQKFWILLGVAIIMTLVGWWMSTAALATTIATRKSDIEKAFKKVPTGTIPNEDWTKKLSEINAEQERAIARTQSDLWKRQLAKMMTWPDGVDLKNGYWGLFSNPSMETNRQTYRSEVERVWREVNPLDETGAGIVSFPQEHMYAILRQQPWQRYGDVTSEKMWEVKEDLWLLERLFQSIDSVNGGADVSRNDAAIHVISDLQLRGGGAKAAGDADPMGGMGGMGGGMGGGLAGDEKEFMRGQMGGRGAMGGRGGIPGTGANGMAEALTPIPADFDPSEEFGDDGGGGSTFAAGPMAARMIPGGQGGGVFGSGNRGGGMGKGDDEYGAGGLPGGMAAVPTLTRYISKEEGKPFKTRGFYLSVIMDHTKIPDLIAELTSCEGSDLPVEVIRVQMSRLHEDQISQQTTGVRPGMGRPGMTRSNMADDDDRPRGGRGMGSPFGASGMGGMIGGGGANNPFAARPTGGLPGQSTFPGSSTNFDPAYAAAYATAEASLNKALADPVMAQVSLCGIFTLYQKMPEPAEAPAPTSTPAASEDATGTDPAATSTEASATAADGENGEVTTESPTANGTDANTPSEPENETPATTDAAATKPDEVKLEEDK